jgi:putative phage-type endonuclease
MNEKVKNLIERVYHEQRSQEWLDLRYNMLTASDVASVIGVNSFESPEDVMYKKCGFRRPMRDTTAVDHGTFYETEARDIYASRFGEVVYEIGLVPHPIHRWLGGSPDGITESGKLIEIKCPLSRKITETVPVYYVPQVQLLMEILDLDECDFIQYDPRTTPPTFVCTNLKRDRAWFDEQLPIMDVFWKIVSERRKKPLCEIRDENGIFIHDEVCPL